MSTEFWKIEKDLCRCCHSEGSHKNLAEPCLEGGEEIYSEMLHDTLDINISPVSGDLGTVTYTICEVCIMRLQDAWSFKQQVLQCENRFNDLYTKNVIKLEPDCVVVSIKEEADSDNEGFKEEKLDDSDGDFEMSFGDGNNSDSDMDTKPKSKAKPKAKSKTTPKAPPKRKPATKTASKTSTTSEAAEGQAEPKEKKDAPLSVVVGPSDSDYSTIKEKCHTRRRCNICHYITPTIWKMKVHIHKEHNPQNGISCPLCEVKFLRKNVKQKHLAVIHGVREKVKHGYVMLEEIHSKVCSKCELEFQTLPKLKQHKCDKELEIPGETGDLKQLLKCDTCAEEFRTLSELREHRLRHPIFECGHCNLKFSYMERLQHIEEQHSNKLFICDVCGYRNGNKSQVSVHRRKVHLKAKKAACPHCDMKFFDNTDLKKYMVRHDPVKNFKCNFCNKAFARLTTLRTHEKIHTGDKNIICYVCGERFVQKASLSYHMSKHHPGGNIQLCMQ